MQSPSSQQRCENAPGEAEQIPGSFLLFEAIDAPLLVMNEDGRVVFFNGAAERATGYRRKNVLGTRFFDEMTLPDDSSNYLTHNGIFAERNGSGSRVIRTFHADASGVLFLAWSAGPVRLQKNGEKYRVFTARDETRERKLLTDEKRHSSAIESINEGVALMDSDWRITYINPAFERITGYARADLIGKRPDVLMDETTEIKFFGSVSRALKNAHNWQGQTVNVRPDGTRYECEESVTALALPDKSYNYVAILRDITEKNRAEKRIREALDYSENIVEHAPVGVWIFDCREILEGTAEYESIHMPFRELSFDLRTAQVNQKLQSILGLPKEAFDDLTLLDPSLVDETHAMEMVKELRALLYGKEVSFETLFQRGEKHIPVFVEAIPLRMMEERAEQIMLMILDMSERKWMDEQLRNSEEELKWTLRKLFQANQALEENSRRLEAISTTDELTGVPNRRKFHEFLGHEWRRSVRKNLPISLVLVDIDYFKYYNDTYGHQGGDECLRTVAQAMNGYMQRTTDLVARFGGEEFVALLPETSLEGALVVAERLRSLVEKLGLENRRSEFGIVTLSIGVATCFPQDEMEEATIIGAADKALYQAKQEGRNRVHGEMISGS